MNEKQPYEKHLAEKLQQIPPLEDINQNWEQMRLLLEKEMPRGGGFGSNGRGGNGRWWTLGIIALILLLGTWVTGKRYFTRPSGNQPTVAAIPTTATEKEGNPSNGPSSRSLSSEVKPPAAEIRPVPPVNTLNKAPAETMPHSLALANTTTTKVKTNDKIILKKEHNKPANNTRSNNGIKDNRDLATSQKMQPLSLPSHPEENRLHASLVTIKVNYTGSMVISPDRLINNSIQRDYATSLFPVKADVTKSTARSSRTKKNQEDKTYAFGLSLPLAFPLGDQQALGYNSRAGSNTISDYIPAPHFQYHLNSKTYLQAEVQVTAPQFIRPILLYQSRREDPVTSSYIYNSVFAKKLYYFNLPVGIHYSPFKNFYLGTGLQFSSLWGGVALSEQRQVWTVNPREQLLGQQYSSFKHDTLSQRFSPNEIRLVMDVNYYLSRFTVGLSYNQSFSNYASFRINSGLPYEFDKNKALQFYLKYNIWEDKKRKQTPKSLLTFK